MGETPTYHVALLRPNSTPTSKRCNPFYHHFSLQLSLCPSLSNDQSYPTKHPITVENTTAIRYQHQPITEQIINTNHRAAAKQ
jgi:hypothetical protein